MTDLAQLRRRVEGIRRAHADGYCAEADCDGHHLLAYADAATKLLREAARVVRHKRGCQINPGGPIMAALGRPDPVPCSCGASDVWRRIDQLCGPDETGEG